MELPHVLAIAKLRASIANHRSEEQTLRNLATTSESDNVKQLAGRDLIRIAEQIAVEMEEIRKFEAE